MGLILRLGGVYETRGDSDDGYFSKVNRSSAWLAEATHMARATAVKILFI